MKGLYLSFWKKNSGNALTHVKGLTQEQVDALRELKVGDRLILFSNDVDGETKPAFTLKKARLEDRNPPSDGGL